MKFSPELLKQLRIQASQGSEPARRQLQAWARARKPRAPKAQDIPTWLERYGNPRTWKQDMLAQTDGARILDGLNKYGAFNPLPHLKRYAHLLRGGDRQSLSHKLERTALQHLKRDRAIAPLRQVEDRARDVVRSLFSSRPRTPTGWDPGVNMNQVRDMQGAHREHTRNMIPELRSAQARLGMAEALLEQPEPLEPLFRALEREGRSVFRARAGTGVGAGGLLSGLGINRWSNRQKEAGVSPGTGHVPPSSFQANPLTPPKPIQPISPPPPPKPLIGAGVGPKPLPFKRKTPNYWGSKV